MLCTLSLAVDTLCSAVSGCPLLLEATVYTCIPVYMYEYNDYFHVFSD